LLMAPLGKVPGDTRVTVTPLILGLHQFFSPGLAGTKPKNGLTSIKTARSVPDASRLENLQENHCHSGVPA